ncbi:MAG: hypothetical protein A3G75_14275 [Verrucomicrobia bacterium RIFCSPLOWO2_12_FULL_64_8]|nr:MAG: hypothetical protein A3G75_14275 [Verrucomicrobia bacterium RIFCSPLOWO2_12_FULL_64_8]
MTSIFADLRKRVKNASLPNSFLARELCRDLLALERGNAPRSLAAMALGTLQKAHEKTKDDTGLHAKLAEIWNEFSEKFIAGEIGPEGNSSGDIRLSSEEHTLATNIICSHPPLTDGKKFLLSGALIPP